MCICRNIFLFYDCTVLFFKYYMIGFSCSSIGCNEYRVFIDYIRIINNCIILLYFPSSKCISELVIFCFYWVCNLNCSKCRTRYNICFYGISFSVLWLECYCNCNVWVRFYRSCLLWCKCISCFKCCIFIDYIIVSYFIVIYCPSFECVSKIIIFISAWDKSYISKSSTFCNFFAI